MAKGTIYKILGVDQGKYLDRSGGQWNWRTRKNDPYVYSWRPKGGKTFNELENAKKWLREAAEDGSLAEFLEGSRIEVVSYSPPAEKMVPVHELLKDVKFTYVDVKNHWRTNWKDATMDDASFESWVELLKDRSPEGKVTYKIRDLSNGREFHKGRYSHKGGGWSQKGASWRTPKGILEHIRGNHLENLAARHNAQSLGWGYSPTPTFEKTSMIVISSLSGMDGTLEGATEVHEDIVVDIMRDVSRETGLEIESMVEQTRKSLKSGIGRITSIQAAFQSLNVGDINEEEINTLMTTMKTLLEALDEDKIGAGKLIS